MTETVIAVTSALLGVLLSNGFAVWLEARRRAQRAIDMIVALHSEILAGVVANRRQLTPEEAHYALKQTSPFATPDETDFVFDSVKNDLSIMPAEVIHPVVQYYRVAKQTNLITEDLRDPYFLAQSKSEKRKILRTLLELVEFQKMLGEAALAELAAYAVKKGIDLADKESRAATLIEQARADITAVFRRSELSGLSLKSPTASGRPKRPAKG